ncbi:MAG: 2-oxoglutarate dehydrogenase, E2 component, dihydrolipoamide succinyltransferase, partial [Actinomycetales bacterium]
TMPALGESVTEGTVTRWLKAEGDSVEVDEPLLEVSTDKVDTEIPSPAAGVLSKILVQEDEVVPVGGDLAVIGGESGGESSDDSAEADDAQPSAEQEAPEAPSAEAPAAEAPAAEAPAADAPAQASGQQEAPAQEKADEATEQASQPAAQAAPTEAAPAPATATAPAASTSTTTSTTTSTSANKGASDDSSAYVTPLVRKLAAQHSVDLGALTGTGIGGRIRKQDVLDAAENARAAAAASAAPAQPAAAAPAPSVPAGGGAAAAPVSDKRGTREKMTRLRKVIATRMVESLRVSAQLTTVVEVDLTKVARLRARAKSEFERREGVKLSYLPFLALAAVEALKAHPNVNASVDGEEIVYHGQENLAIAVDTEKGLLVPVVKNAGDLNIAGLARAIADLADRTRNNKIAPDDLAGGTFTITNTGSRGALFDTPIINQPQVAILGTGALVKRPVVVADEDGGETIAVRSMMYLALSYDHRIVDGADAARFLGAMKTRLEEGRFEASLGL